MKVLQIIREVGGPGGLAVCPVVLDRTLKAFGHVTLTAAMVKRDMSSVPENTLQAPSIYGPNLEGNSSWKMAKFLGSLPWVPDVILAHQPPFSHVAKDLQRIAPLVIFQHTYLCRPGHLFRDKDEVCTRKVGPGCIARWYGRQCGSDKHPKSVLRMLKQVDRDRESLLSASMVVANSHYLKTQLEKEGIPPNHIEVVHPGCSLLISDCSPQTHSRSPDPLVSFAGRVVYRKGLNVLVDAMSMSGAVLEIAGEGWHLPQIQRPPYVRFRGYLQHSEIAALHQYAWVSTLPSLWPEPFGMTGLEALSQGTPVVAFDVGGVSEWLSPEVGVLVDSDKNKRVERLAATLANFLRKPPSSELSEACKRQAEDLCGLNSFGQRIESVLKKVLK